MESTWNGAELTLHSAEYATVGSAGWLASSLIDTLKCEVTVKHAPIEELVRLSTNWSPGKPGRWRVKSALYGVSADVHPPAEGAFRRDEIRALDVGVIRFELVLRNGYLKAHGLQHPKAWTSRKVRTLIAARISNLMPGDGHVPTLPERAQHLTAGQWMKLRLWALEDVAALGSPSTYERDRRAIRSATGFDVASHACADDQRRIYRPVREELLRGLAFRCHWSEWTVHGEELNDFLATKRALRPVEKSQPDVPPSKQVVERLITNGQ